MNQIPNNIEAEEHILGASISQQEARDHCLSKLSEDHFYDLKNKRLFKTIQSMASKSVPIDTRTVLASMGNKDLELGAYLFGLGRLFPTMAHVEFYVEDLKKQYRLRKLLELAEDIKREAPLSAEKEGYFDQIERRFFDLTEERQEDNLVQDSAEKLLVLIDDIKEGRGIGAISTGVSAIDHALQGVAPGMMDVYAAEAGAGKTSLIEMIALKFLREDRPIVVFERDMTPTGFMMRLACRMAGVNVSAIRRWGAKMPKEIEEVKKCIQILSRSHLKLYSPDGCTGADVRMIARREKRRSSTELVIIDHIRTLKHSKSTSWDGLEENSGYIRQSTNETGIPHIVLTHINRSGAKSDRPTISDIKGGDQLKDDADNCCVMWLPEGRPEKDSGVKQWKVNFAFDKTRWDFNLIETMNFHGPKMTFEKIERSIP